MDRESTGSSNKCFDAEFTRPTRSHGGQRVAMAFHSLTSAAFRIAVMSANESPASWSMPTKTGLSLRAAWHSAERAMLDLPHA
jgi:hypothetical protein